MGTISNYEDLLCWQLSVQLRNELIPESSTHLGEALARKYVTPDEHVHFRILAKRAIRAGEGLKGYLEWRISKGRYDEAPPPE